MRRLEGVGYRCHFEKQDGWIGLRNFLLFAPVAIPIGLLTGFITISGRQFSGWQVLLSALGIFFLIAIPEELLFRGIIQNFLEKTFRKPALALIVTSLIFGAAHLNNGPRPDWRYFLLASLAGLFYGNAYQRTRGLMAPAIGSHPGRHGVARLLQVNCALTPEKLTGPLVPNMRVTSTMVRTMLRGNPRSCHPQAYPHDG